MKYKCHGIKYNMYNKLLYFLKIKPLSAFAPMLYSRENERHNNVHNI